MVTFGAEKVTFRLCYLYNIMDICTILGVFIEWFYITKKNRKVPLQILYKYYTNIIQILYKYYTNICDILPTFLKQDKKTGR